MSRLRRAAPGVWLGLELAFYACVLGAFWLGRADAVRSGSDLGGTLARHVWASVAFAAMALLQAAWARARWRRARWLGWAAAACSVAAMIGFWPVAFGSAAGDGLGSVMIRLAALLAFLVAAMSFAWLLFGYAAVQIRRRNGPRPPVGAGANRLPRA